MYSNDEDQLILEAERLGLGLDLNFLKNQFTVEMPSRRENRTFGSLAAALRFVSDLGKNRRELATLWMKKD